MSSVAKSCILSYWLIALRSCRALLLLVGMSQSPAEADLAVMDGKQTQRRQDPVAVRLAALQLPYVCRLHSIRNPHSNTSLNAAKNTPNTDIWKSMLRKIAQAT